MSLSHPFSAKTVAEKFIEGVVKLHGMPKSIISDRDPTFISKFWQEFLNLSGTKLKMSSTYHPQTDGQTEVINRCLKYCLRCFVHQWPRKWHSYLLWAEFWYNLPYLHRDDPVSSSIWETTSNSANVRVGCLASAQSWSNLDVTSRDGQRAMPCWPRPIKGSPRVLVLVSCHAHYSFHAVPTCARARAHSCRAHTCRAMGCVVPCLGKIAHYAFLFFYFFKSVCQVVVLFFSSLCIFFWIHMPLFKVNIIKDSKFKSIFNNNKLIIIR